MVVNYQVVLDEVVDINIALFTIGQNFLKIHAAVSILFHSFSKDLEIHREHNLHKF